jgi:transcription elongation factor/antiterminator RfaH
MLVRIIYAILRFLCHSFLKLSEWEMNLLPNERWFLVHSLPRGEMRAETHLRMQGFRTYLPRIIKTIRHARKFRTALAPLFPRYLFIALNLDRDRWLSVRSTVGVSCLFTCAGLPVPAPAGIVEALLEHDANASLISTYGGLNEGQLVRILSGPFADFVGTLDRMDEFGRVRVLLDVMGRAVPIVLCRTSLSPAA